MLVDTAGLLSLCDRTDSKHADAVVFFGAALRRVTHNYVLAEFVALAHSRGLERRRVLEFINALFQEASLDLVWVDEKLHRAGMDLLAERLDKGYSLCDAVSFIVMGLFDLEDALTSDHHFSQAGFRRLLA